MQVSFIDINLSVQLGYSVTSIFGIHNPARQVFIEYYNLSLIRLKLSDVFRYTYSRLYHSSSQMVPDFHSESSKNILQQPKSKKGLVVLKGGLVTLVIHILYKRVVLHRL